jgi:hypothetical protein
MKEKDNNHIIENNDIITYNTRRDLRQPSYRGARFDEKDGNSDDEQNTEFINQEIPVDINDQTDSSGSRINLSADQERIIQKLPSFRMGDRKIHDEVINSDKYLNYKEYKPFILRNPPLFFWFLGLCFIGFGFTLIINICLSKYNKNFISGFIGHYAWEYIIIAIIFTVFVLVFATCSFSPTNRKFISNDEYNKAIIGFPDGSTIEIEVENWMPNTYNDGLIIISKDGTRYRVDSVNCILIME